MADSISIAGIGLRLTRFTERARLYRGEVAVTFDNTLKDGRDRPLRTWDAVSDAVTPLVEQSLRAAIATGPVTCSGIVLYGESVYALVSVEDAPRGPDVSSGVPDWTDVNVTLSLVLKESATAPDVVAAEEYVMIDGDWVPVSSGTITP